MHDETTGRQLFQRDRLDLALGQRALPQQLDLAFGRADQRDLRRLEREAPAGQATR